MIYDKKRVFIKIKNLEKLDDAKNIISDYGTVCKNGGSSDLWDQTPDNHFVYDCLVVKLDDFSKMNIVYDDLKDAGCEPEFIDFATYEVINF
jgi:hypothetical protein